MSIFKIGLYFGEKGFKQRLGRIRDNQIINITAYQAVRSSLIITFLIQAIFSYEILETIFFCEEIVQGNISLTTTLFDTIQSTL